jgi:hypothetical protein
MTRSSPIPILYGEVTSNEWGNCVAVSQTQCAEEWVGTEVEIRPVKEAISANQRRYYWKTLREVYAKKAKEFGFFSPEALHESIKAYIAQTHRDAFAEAFIGNEFSTTALPKEKFTLFMDLIKAEIFTEIFGVSIDINEED